MKDYTIRNASIEELIEMVDNGQVEKISLQSILYYIKPSYKIKRIWLSSSSTFPSMFLEDIKRIYNDEDFKEIVLFINDVDGLVIRRD